MRFVVLIILCLHGAVAQGDQTYLAPLAFLQQTFGEQIPATQTLTLTTEHQKKIKTLAKRSYRAKRVKWWRNGSKTAMILEEIGKTKPITIGYVINNGSLESVRVLIYRESHGHEVRQKFFTKQFVGARLNGKKLSKPVNNIAGATLSVRALTRMGMVALYLDSQI